MKTLVTMFLLLAPLHPVRAALVGIEDCCANSAVENAATLNQRGTELYAAGDYASAETTLREALKIQDSETIPHSNALAGMLFNLAAVARMQSHLPEAEALYKRAIEIRESLARPDSNELAAPLAGLALVYMTSNRTPQAVELAERAVRLSTHPGIAQNTLATLLLSQGAAARAEALEQQVVDALKLAGETNSREYVDALSNLGTSRLRLANYRQSELDLRQAETAALKLAGPDHPQTATIWNNLAKARAAQGDSKGAEVLFAKAIAAWRKSLGAMHPDVAYGLSNLAALYQSHKRYPEAERLFRQALEIDATAFGAASLKVANDWSNLGALSAARHRYSDAETQLSKGLTIAQMGAGNEHSDTAGIAVNLAVVYLSQGRNAEAYVLLAKAVPVKERVLAPNSPELTSLLKLYATVLQANRVTTHDTLMAKAR